MPLHSFTWHITIPQDSTIDLQSTSRGLQQSLPGQECTKSSSLLVSEDGGSSLGEFCANGVIEKVQVHANVSVTALNRNFKKNLETFLNVSFSQEIRGKT